MKTTLFVLFFSLVMSAANAQPRQLRAKGLQDSLLHKDYKPKTIFKNPMTAVLKAKYPVIDMHMHAPRVRNLDSVALVVIKNMNETGIQKTILFSGIGKTFDQVMAAFGKYPDRFEIWCGFDFSDYPNPGFGAKTIAELERCVKLGAKGVGEIHDKGMGMAKEGGSKETSKFLHIDDPLMDPILDKMAELKLPLNFHGGDPIWMYEPMDAHNDLLFESYYYRLDDKKNITDLPGIVTSLEKALKKHPRNIIVACHFLNQEYDLPQLGKILDKYPNLYADVSQREAYVAAIPRYAKQFMEKYADRLVYGTDQGYSIAMYRNTFHIWETTDEHFYAWDVSNSPWPLSGLGLSDATLKKLYHDNALKIIKK